MNRIQILSEHVKQKIAAGEVVEGPFSVVKELLENAIDAGSTEINIEIHDAGLKKIVVKDNGTGIHSEDVPLAITEHATSKITDVDDILEIYYFGFRREALSSISSFANSTILTRTKEEEIGTKLYKHATTVETSSYAGPVGTTIIVENLFYSIPARKKFLKASRTELKYIRDIFYKIALAHHEIAFTLDVDNKRIATLPAVKDLDARARKIYSGDIIDNCYFDTIKDLKVSIKGFLSKPHYVKSNRTYQHLYINKRPVVFKYFNFILSRGYDAILHRGQYPVALLFIEIDPSLVDVNLHPAKREIKFFDQKYIDGLIYSLTKKVLDSNHLINETVLKQQNVSSNTVAEPYVMKENDGALFKKSDNRMQQTRMSFLKNSNVASDYSLSHKNETQTILKDTREAYEKIETDDDFLVIGQTLGTYILIEKNEELFFIDFHAAHERIIFDSLQKEELNIETQNLLVPEVMEFSMNDFDILRDTIDSFNKIGFDINEFSENSIAINGIPELVYKNDYKKVLLDFLDSYKKELVAEPNTNEIKEKMYAKLACHSAKRAGDNLTDIDMDKIAQLIFSGEYEKRCPHGRPFVFSVNKNDLERMFKRS